MSYSGNTSAFQAEAAGSIPAIRSIFGLRGCIDRLCAHIAQLVERVLGKDEVTGSIPVMSSINLAVVFIQACVLCLDSSVF